MKLTVKFISVIFLCVNSFSFSQMEQYHFKRELRGISEQWHNIVLPNEVFGKINQDFSDVRIFGITKDKDTIETPYLLRTASESISTADVVFKTLNPSYHNGVYYATFEVPTSEAINQIKLDFKQQNFDWQVTLEGSQNQTDWFAVLDNYRILSIKNEATDFQFTELRFPSSKYRFFRLRINSEDKPELNVAKIAQYQIADGKYRNYTIQKFNIKENKAAKQTEIDIDLQMRVPISLIKIDVTDSYDYYRPVTIKYLADSIKTEQGWRYSYRTLTTNTLNSLEVNEFKFSSTLLQRLKIVVHNQDNQPLSINKIQVKGYEHELMARFTVPASYFLTYGNSNATQPHYDISRFTDKVPEVLTALELGKEMPIPKEKVTNVEPLFKNKTWLWLIMGVIMVTLGWFSVKMMLKK